MKKVFKHFIAVWAIFLILFNVITFVSVGSTGAFEYLPSFWSGYIFITLSFIGQFICAYFALKDDKLNKVFYNISLITTSYSGLIISFIIGCLCMTVSLISYWVGILLCAIVLAFNIVAVIKASVAINIVSGIDDKVAVKTSFIKTLTIDAESLLGRTKNETVKAECKKIYEAIRYSDPMSNEALASIESEIKMLFSELSDAVISENLEIVAKLTDELIFLLAERNKKCKSLKKV